MDRRETSSLPMSRSPTNWWLYSSPGKVEEGRQKAESGLGQTGPCSAGLGPETGEQVKKPGLTRTTSNLPTPSPSQTLIVPVDLRQKRSYKEVLLSSSPVKNKDKRRCPTRRRMASRGGRGERERGFREREADSMKETGKGRMPGMDIEVIHTERDPALKGSGSLSQRNLQVCRRPQLVLMGDLGLLWWCRREQTRWILRGTSSVTNVKWKDTHQRNVTWRLHVWFVRRKHTLQKDVCGLSSQNA